MTEALARSLRGKIEILLPYVWVAGFRIVNGARWELEVRDYGRPRGPWIIVTSRAQAVKMWPVLDS